MDYNSDTPGWPHGQIPVVMFFLPVPEQEAEIQQAAAKAGVAPLLYMYNLIRTQPERFIAPLPEGGTAPCPAGEDGSPEAGCAAPQGGSAPR